MIDPCARAEVLADAVMDTLKAERDAAPVFDDYVVAAHCFMTTHARYGDTTRTARMIAADLREFVRKQISASPPLIPTSLRVEEENPLSVARTIGRGTGL